MGFARTRRAGRNALLVTGVVLALFGVGLDTAAADEPEVTAADSIVEITVADRAAVDGLIDRGFDLVEYLREEADGRVTVNVVADDDELAELQSLGYQLGATIENLDTYKTRIAERNEALAAEERSHEAAESGDPTSKSLVMSAGLHSTAFFTAATPELTVNRVDYFQNYAGWFLSVEVYDNLVNGTGTTGPTVSFSWRTASGDFGSATTIPRYIDSDPTPDVYMYNRILVRIGAASA